MSLKKFLRGETGFGSVAGGAAVLVLRAFAGLTLAFNHGLHKLPPSERFINGVQEMGFPLPEVFAYAAGFSEFGGGILLTMGLGTRLSSFFILATMIVAVFVRHADDPFGGSRELAALYGIVAVMFMITGPGRFSVDAMLRRQSGQLFR